MSNLQRLGFFSCWSSFRFFLAYFLVGRSKHPPLPCVGQASVLHIKCPVSIRSSHKVADNHAAFALDIQSRLYFEAP
ncbi:hypothetical protein B0T14DRAFT_118132 [Immersiella caudata]|uniref:Secreted protein n=1 Tax=Immersiella caudata TaxID=314043 RepID=A0AA40C6C8_9PEZI|nr:hypothetical protein B0T14DRAFT_118132 [Immersiella caudata]